MQTSTPIDPYIKLGKVEEDVPVEMEMYQRLFGKRIYLSHVKTKYSICSKYNKSTHAESGRSSFAGNISSLLISKRDT